MTKNKKNIAKFILASASPRRRELLSEAGYDFEVVVSNIDESKFDDHQKTMTTGEYVVMLARAKAMKVAQKYPNRLVVGADTVADFDGEIIGKAVDSKHVREIIGKLFSQPHEIVTGIVMLKLDEGIEAAEFDVTTVYPRPMSEDQITGHIASGDWKDKAGAYSIRSNGDEFVERIEGSESNVMGLGMELFERMIKNFGIAR